MHSDAVHVLALNITEKDVLPRYITSKTKYISFKIGCFILVKDGGPSNECVISYSQRRLCISIQYNSKRRFTHCTLLTRQNAFVLKWVCCMAGKAFKKRDQLIVLW